MNSVLPGSATADLYLVGIGIGGQARMTEEARTTIAAARRIVHLTPLDDGAWSRLAPDTHVHSLSWAYEVGGSLRNSYLAMRAAAVDAAQQAHAEDGYACFVMYGHPLWFVSTSRMLREQAGELDIRIQVVPGISSLDTLLIDSPVDVGSGALVCDGFQFLRRNIAADARYPIVLMHFAELAASGGVKALAQRLESDYPDDHVVHIVRSGVITGHLSSTTSCRVKDLVGVDLSESAGCTLVIPALKGPI